MKRRLLIWLGLAVVLLVSAWWVFYFPFNADRLYRAIPSNAGYVSRHRDVGERWRHVVDHDVIRAALAAGDVDASDIDQAIESPLTSVLVQMFASQETVVAYVPYFGRGSQPAWVLASWGGSSAQAVRLGLLNKTLSGFERFRLPSGARAWKMDASSFRPGYVATITALEGVLLAAISPDGEAVGYLASRVRRRAGMHPYLADVVHEPTGGAFDTAWVQWLENAGEGYRARHARVGLDLSSSRVVRGQVQTRLEWADSLSPAAFASDRRIGQGSVNAARWLGTRPDACLIAPVTEAMAMLAPWLPATSVPAFDVIREALPEPRETEGLLALLSSQSGGRLFGMKVPVLAALVPLATPAEGEQAIARLIDACNAEYGWALLPRRTEVRGHPVISLESSRRGFFGVLPESDRPAFAVWGRYLVVCSNRAALTELLTATPGPVPGWHTTLGSQPGRLGVWTDLQRSGAGLRNAIAVASLAVMMGQLKGDQNLRAVLDQSRVIIEAVQPLGTLTVWLEAWSPETSLQFCLGKEAGAQGGQETGGRRP